jgi:hypothetical protein
MPLSDEDRMVRLRFLFLVVLLAACSHASPRSGAASRAGEDVVGVANALFAAMEAKDTLTLRRIFVPDARLLVIRMREGMDPSIQSRGLAEFISSVARSPEVLRERMWDPQVAVDGELASLWASYDFHQGERLTHCGVDAFHFVRVRGDWRIAALTYTVETSSCPRAPTGR